MASNDVRAANIDKSLPIVTKTVIIGEKCDSCGQKTQGEFKFTANAGAILADTRTFDCGNSKCNAKITSINTIRMPLK